MADLAVLVPTRGRPGNVEKVISTWDFTNAWDVADLVLIADSDDPEIEGYRALVDRFECGAPRDLPSPLTLIEVPRWMPMVHKLDATARELAGRYFALGFAGDDHLPRTIGWARRYLTVLRELGTGMVYGDDGYQGANLSTEWALTSDVVRVLGRMVPAPVEHMYSDASLLDLARAAGIVRHLPEVRVEHMHPVVKKAPSDAQYQRVNSRDQFRKDREIYEAWKAQEMAGQVASIRTLTPGQPEPRRLEPRRSTTPKRKAAKRMNPIPKVFRRVKGATPDEIGLALADFATQVPADQAIVELGVFQGRTALLMAWGARQGDRAHVWAIDAWNLAGNLYGPPFTDPGTRNWARYNVRATGYSNDVTLVQGFSLAEAEKWSGPSVGLLFIDGDHSYDGARGDFLSWSHHLAPGAVVAFDDYGHPDWPGVAEAVDALVSEGILDPVEIFHDRLAVTRVAESVPTAPAAVTSEGVSPEPTTSVPVHELQPVEPVNTESGPPEGWVQQGDGSWVEPDPVATQPAEAWDRMTVRGWELKEVAEGTAVTELNTFQLRALAKIRGIKLGARKDKRDAMLDALKTGA